MTAAESFAASAQALSRLASRIKATEDAISYAIAFPAISGGELPLLRRQLAQLQEANSSLAKATANATLRHLGAVSDP